MNVLITGGAGFIGSNLAIRLVNNHPEDRFIVVDKLTYAGNLANLKPIEKRSNFQFVRGDITDREAMALLCEQVDVVANLAAESHVDRSIESSVEFIRTNITGTHSLLDAALAAGVKRFVQISTDEVYGTLGPDDPPFTEDNDLAPNSPYAASKASADLLVRSYAETYGLNTCITRCSNNYGPLQFPEKLIPLMLTNALEGRDLPVYGDGSNIRDWIHVDDHCAGIEAAIYRGSPGMVYNFGGDCEMSNLDLVKALMAALARATGRDAAEFLDRITFVADRLGHDWRYAMAFDRTTAALSWRPAMGIEQGLNDTVAWYLAHEDWWRSIKTGAYLEYYDRHYGEREVIG